MYLSLQHGTEVIKMEVVFRRRKTMEIQVHPGGVVRVLVPVGTPAHVILERVKSKEGWIAEKLDQLKDAGCLPAGRELVNGETLLYLGRNYPLQIQVAGNLKEASVKLYRGRFQVVVPVQTEDIVREVLKEWYIQKAGKKVKERVEYYGQKLRKTPLSIKIKDQRRRWGSCTSDGKLLFNWRIIMAPVRIIDYLVVHEMCHLYHMNHSKEFWYLVASILPDYKERREWLKKNGAIMDL